jgi:phage baseplate assembly protein gpV
MDRFLNLLKAQSAGLDSALAQPRFGIVSSFDPATYTARVLMQPEAVLSGWLPVLTVWGGGGWGMACPPSPGQQVLVLAQEGQSEHGVIVGTAFSQAMAPPNAPAGEFWLVHKTGSLVKLQNDGDVVVQAGQITLNGPVQVNGNLTVDGTITDATGQIGLNGG